MFRYRPHLGRRDSRHRSTVVARVARGVLRAARRPRAGTRQSHHRSLEQWRKRNSTTCPLVRHAARRRSSRQGICGRSADELHVSDGCRGGGQTMGSVWHRAVRSRRLRVERHRQRPSRLTVPSVAAGFSRAPASLGLNERNAARCCDAEGDETMALSGGTDRRSAGQDSREDDAFSATLASTLRGES